MCRFHVSSAQRKKKKKKKEKKKKKKKPLEQQGPPATPASFSVLVMFDLLPPLSGKAP